jgi:hypothetical protein
MPTEIYTGPWIEHSHGQIVGATLTTTSRNGAFLLAAISIFVIAAGSQFWTILTFVIHQLNATTDPTDALHCQHQAIFRNSGSSVGTARELFKLPFSWRRKPNRRIGSKAFLVITIRSWTWASLATINFLAWASASLFSSEVTKSAGGDVLIQPGNCGYYAAGTTSENVTLNYRSRLRNARKYARACYKDNLTSPTECNIFTQESIPWSTNPNAPCPFESGGMRCAPGSAALELDTKSIDSHKDLGINAPPHDRVLYRKIARCAVLDPEQIEKIKVSVDDPVVPQLPFQTYHYYLGPYSGYNYTFEEYS